MANTLGKRSNGGDEENTAFGRSAKLAEHKSGFDRKVVKQGAETGKHPRRRPSAEKDIPQESLAARIAKRQKGA